MNWHLCSFDVGDELVLLWGPRFLRESRLLRDRVALLEKQAADKKAADGFDVFGFAARFAPLIFLVVLMAVFAIVEPRFLSQVNLFNTHPRQ